VRFAPERVTLPGGASAAVVGADTANGLLQVPDDVRRVGWWTGSAYVGDPFGPTVLAGHVGSSDQGIGFFARLLAVEKVTGPSSTDVPTGRPTGCARRPWWPATRWPTTASRWTIPGRTGWC
jgi:hypothetical protein